MAKDLESFITELHKDVETFAAWWMEQNRENPDHFPLEFNDDNEGMWWESFVTYAELR